ncbi:hypothetical protein KZX47_10315 [Thermus sp. SYSU G05001]|uniref:Uncharacterized protein n=1 Tax=Thermus brevis TaxID=2862456 RepID=A0ABS6ZZR8_9DEIN|nr:hypothetical protein [Thermus brevis]MBW6395542.1 hypothetical protein [Thermus brevis]
MEEPLVVLEEYLTTPTGQRARRCQHVLPGGRQCGMPALRGELFCRRHLPQDKRGSRPEQEQKRPKAKPLPPEAKEALEAAQATRGGHPVYHGLYTEAGARKIRDLAEEILRLEQDLDNTDRELAVLKAALLWLLDRAQEYQEKAEALSRLLAGLEALTPSEDPQVLRLLAEDLRQANRLQEALASWTDRLMEAAMRVVNAVKQRAETRAKVAEARALEQFVRLTTAVRDILWEVAPEDVLNIFEERLQREVLEKASLALPERARA